VKKALITGIAALFLATGTAHAANCLSSSSQYCSCVRAEVASAEFTASAEFKRFDKRWKRGDRAVPANIVKKVHVKCGHLYGS
jgi:hypothetical protein